ncbi:MAG: hypothetical protein ACOZF0_11380 [Thermodesulfobacteriota bacterium]
MIIQPYQKLLRFAGIFLLIFILGWIDWWSGYEFNFFVFYFIPIGLSAWLFGFESSLFISIMSSLTWYIAEHLSGHSYSSPVYAYWNTLIRLISFMVIGWSFSRIHYLFRSEKIKTESLEKALTKIQLQAISKKNKHFWTPS